MLEESVCRFRGAGSILSFYSIFDSNNVDPDQSPHYVWTKQNHEEEILVKQLRLCQSKNETIS